MATKEQKAAYAKYMRYESLTSEEMQLANVIISNKAFFDETAEESEDGTR